MKTNRLKTAHYNSDPWRRPAARKSKQKAEVKLPTRLLGKKHKKIRKLLDDAQAKMNPKPKPNQMSFLKFKELKKYQKSAMFAMDYGMNYSSHFLHQHDYMDLKYTPSGLGKSALQLSATMKKFKAIAQETNSIILMDTEGMSPWKSFWDEGPTMEQRAGELIKTTKGRPSRTELMVAFAEKEAEEVARTKNRHINRLTNNNHAQSQKIVQQYETIEEQRDTIKALRAQLELQQKQRATICERSITITERVRHFREDE